jgi:hypothetical protein
MEIYTEELAARLMGGFTHRPYRQMLRKEYRDKELYKLSEYLRTANKQYGRVDAVYIEDGSLSVRALDEYISQQERLHGYTYKHVVVDYASFLDVSEKCISHERLHIITKQLRKLARARNIVLWTAFQPKGTATGGKSKDDTAFKCLDLGDLGESAGPGKVLDLLISCGLNRDTGTGSAFVVKNRHGRAREVPIEVASQLDYGIFGGMAHYADDGAF